MNARTSQQSRVQSRVSLDMLAASDFPVEIKTNFTEPRYEVHHQYSRSLRMSDRARDDDLLIELLDKCDSLVIDPKHAGHSSIGWLESAVGASFSASFAEALRNAVHHGPVPFNIVMTLVICEKYNALALNDGGSFYKSQSTKKRFEQFRDEAKKRNRSTSTMESPIPSTAGDDFSPFGSSRGLGIPNMASADQVIIDNVSGTIYLGMKLDD